MIAPRDVTGLVLAGGLGRRMGGVDKGLVLHAGMPLAQRALRRLAPQVGAVAVNANRNAAAYAAFGAPVWPDGVADRPGPLAGILAGLRRCRTPFLATVPCDAPSFPIDLVERLAEALAREAADLAVAASVDGTGSRKVQPVFCLARTSLADDLARFLTDGGRRVGAWIALQRHVEVAFDDAGAFANLNTDDDLRRFGPA